MRSGDRAAAAAAAATGTSDAKSHTPVLNSCHLVKIQASGESTATTESRRVFTVGQGSKEANFGRKKVRRGCWLFASPSVRGCRLQQQHWREARKCGKETQAGRRQAIISSRGPSTLSLAIGYFFACVGVELDDGDWDGKLTQNFFFGRGACLSRRAGRPNLIDQSTGRATVREM